MIRMPIASDGKTTILTKVHDIVTAFEICAGRSWLSALLLISWKNLQLSVQRCIVVAQYELLVRQ